MSQKENLSFKSILNKKDFVSFLNLLDTAPLRTSTGRDSILTFLETYTFRLLTLPRRPDDFNLYHPAVVDYYNDLLIFCKSQFLIDDSSGYGHRTEKLNQDFNAALKKFYTARSAFIRSYPQEVTPGHDVQVRTSNSSDAKSDEL